jgi:hypothetical protein
VPLTPSSLNLSDATAPFSIILSFATEPPCHNLFGTERLLPKIKSYILIVCS